MIIEHIWWIALYNCYLNLYSCNLLKYLLCSIIFSAVFFYGKLGRVIYFDIDLISVDKLIETSTKRGANVIVWKIVKRLLWWTMTIFQKNLNRSQDRLLFDYIFSHISSCNSFMNCRSVIICFWRRYKMYR